MAYESVDQLQLALADTIFHYTKEPKKAAGRALGTLVEIIIFYLAKSWGFESSVTIERDLPEYGHTGITHKVEFSLHPVFRGYRLLVRNLAARITAARILSEVDKEQFSLVGFQKTENVLLTKTKVLRNSCIVAIGDRSHLVATLDVLDPDGAHIRMVEQCSKPYAMFECKRVGIEEGTKKGPQTIEKAKQGAYVAKSVSSLQKIRSSSGVLLGVVHKANGDIYSKPYAELMAEILSSEDAELLRDFILTVGVVSNHGNWFTLENHNKELKVLAQSYDWLVFLTDEGLSNFITELLLHPTPLLEPARVAFLASYTAQKKKNQFTKVQMNYEADQVLQAYFRDNRQRIEKWFNVIAPKNGSLTKLHAQIVKLRDENWRKVHPL